MICLFLDWYWVSVRRKKDWLSVRPQLLGYRLVSENMSALVPPGGVPVVGGVLVHGPRHLAVTHALRLCWVRFGSLFGLFGLQLVSLFVFGIG